MKQILNILRKLILPVVFLAFLASCTSIPKSATSDFVGVWKLQDEFTTDYTTPNNYIVINSDDTAKVWSDNGLTILGMYEVDDKGRMYWVHTQAPENPSIEGTRIIVEFNRDGNKLNVIYYPEDNSWRWEGVFDRVNKLPVFTYSNNFEDNILGRIIPQQQEGSEVEWQIIDEPDNPGNKILSPVYADQNSDAEIVLYPGKNFSIEFDIKKIMRLEGKTTSWMALDFNSYTRSDNNYNPFWLNSNIVGSFSSGDREEDYTEQSYKVEGMEWDKWHTLKVKVREGKYFQFFIDGNLFGEREIEETLFTGFKIEGNPVSGIWYMDNLNISWNEVE